VPTRAFRSYRAPETYSDKYTTASEVYSYAIVLWELLTGLRPWHRQADGRLYTESYVINLVANRKKRPEVPDTIDRRNAVAALMKRCWQHEQKKRPSFLSIVVELKPHRPEACEEDESRQRLLSRQQSEQAIITSQVQSMAKSGASSSSERGSSRMPLNAFDTFISFRFGEAHAEALALKAALEARGRTVFLSNASPGSDLQEMIAHALANCKLAIILATKTYGRKTNALFCTSAEMNFIVGNDRKPYFLVRGIPFGDDWAEPLTTMAFPPSIMFKLWLPGEPMPDDLVSDILARLEP